MAALCVSMASEENSPEKCREIRRRRIELRRVASLAAASQIVDARSGGGAGEKRREGAERHSPGKRSRTDGSSSSSTAAGAVDPEVGDPMVPESSGQESSRDPPPAYGVVSLSGRSRDMEDAVSVRTDFWPRTDDRRSPMHFFAVFDGHGGAHVSMLCKKRMHGFLEDEMSNAAGEFTGGEIPPAEWNEVVRKCFERMDEMALSACICGSVGGRCGCEHSGLPSEIVGSTAVVAVIGADRIVVANCGDSRAVLSRGGRAIPLSDDHKPDRPDELARIEDAGGHVIYLNGARVQGILAMSRALGDKYLKRYVISEPEVSITERTPDDEFLILASDGLWDVISNDLACDVTRRCLSDGGPAVAAMEVLHMGGAEPAGSEDIRASHSRCSLAAAILTRLALGRKSSDNISVIVIDLRDPNCR